MSKGRRSQPLPSDWQRIRRRILSRDGGICYLCGQPGAGEVDHLIPASRGGNDDDSNLAAVHKRCHRFKTSREANAVNPLARSRKRQPEPHPGDRGGG